MADLGLYDVDFNGYTTQMQLSDGDAKGYGDRAKRVGSVKKTEPVPVFHGAQVDEGDAVSSSTAKGADGDEDDAKKAAKPAANKARTADNK